MSKPRRKRASTPPKPVIPPRKPVVLEDKSDPDEIMECHVEWDKYTWRDAPAEVEPGTP
jgi:hypothetical protein